MTKTIYIRGLPRSGTNLLEYVLKENFDVNIKSASKHGIIPIPDNTDIRLAYISKHPIDWILSLYAYGWERSSVFESEHGWPNFVYKPIVMLTGPRGMWFRSPVDVWSCYYNHYSTWKRAIHIRLQDFGINTLAALGKRWSLKHKNNKLVWPPYSMNTNAIPTGQQFRRRSRQGMWTPDMEATVMSWVNMTLFKRLGYTDAKA